MRANNTTRQITQMKTQQHKWINSVYHIATNPNCKIEEQKDTRTGYVLNKVFGIDRETWSVTHLPTGLKLPGYFSLLRDAKAYAEALFPLMDWLTLTQDNAWERFPPIKTTILNLVKKHGI